MSVRRPILRYHGGKWHLAKWVIDHFPPHRIYVEPFGGAASVLLRKPRSYAEVYADLDGEIVNVFRVLRDPSTAERLREVVALTPFARDEFVAAYEPTTDPVEMARRTVIRSFMGFGSAAVNPAHSTGFRSNSNRSGTTPARDWRHWPHAVEAFTERLRGVVIENRAAEDLIPTHDTPGTLFYCDPPYVGSTRTALRSKPCSRHEMTDEQHRSLAAVLRAAHGMVIVSGYASDLYEELYGDWRRVEREHMADGAVPRTEVLWISPNADARTAPLFSVIGSETARAHGRGEPCA